MKKTRLFSGTYTCDVFSSKFGVHVYVFSVFQHVYVLIRAQNTYFCVFLFFCFLRASKTRIRVEF